MTKYNSEIHHRRTIRLKNYDYSQVGAYFITICTQNHECLFGKIIDGKMVLNEYGKIAQKMWLEIPNHFPDVQLDEYVIMPNHLHGIIVVNVGVQNFEPLHHQNQIQNFEPLQIRQNMFQHIIPRSIGSIIRGYKIGVTKWCRENTDVYTVWQRNYYEHIIRNENELNKIREYIINNSLKWELDFENPVGAYGNRPLQEHMATIKYKVKK